MKKLIRIKEENNKQLVSAKELYLGLGLNKAHWTRWYETNIQKNDFFSKDKDWTGFTMMENGNETMDFAITLEFAKHIAMMARTEKSHEYRNYFIECEKELKDQSKPDCIEDLIIMQAKSLKDLRQQLQEVTNNVLEAKVEVKEAKEEVQAIRDVIALNPNSWRNEVSNMLNKIAKERGGTQEAYREIRNESYKLLDERAGAKLEIRLTNRRRKVLEETGSRSKADKVSKLDVIASDKRLTEVYLAIVKDMVLKYKS